MPRDLNDPQYLRFMTNAMNKEQEKRLQWFNKHKERIIEVAQFPEHYKEVQPTDVSKAKLNIYLPVFSKDHQNSLVPRRKKPIRDGQVVGLPSFSGTKPDVTTSVSKVMFPVDPKIENILKVSLPDGGRWQYLKARNCLSPEEKYCNEETSSNAYGWRMKDSHLSSSHAPKFGRSCEFMHNLYSRTGPHADPSYYQVLPKEPYNKCETSYVPYTDPSPEPIWKK